MFNMLVVGIGIRYLNHWVGKRINGIVSVG